MRACILVAAAAMGLAIGQGCLVDLDHEIACGDGYIDRQAGEQCDPADPARSHLDACAQTSAPNGRAACDPEFCTIDLSTCNLCGNGTLDEGEECDPAMTGDLTASIPCASVEPPRPGKNFASGVIRGCLADCKFDRSGCNFCGNGKTDGPDKIALSELQPIQMSEAEVCDGLDKPIDALSEDLLCSGSHPDLVENVDCSADCSSFEPRPGGHCCWKRGADCPAPGEAVRCCSEFDHPQWEKHCDDSGFVDPSAPSASSKCL